MDEIVPDYDPKMVSEIIQILENRLKEETQSNINRTDRRRVSTNTTNTNTQNIIQTT